VVKDDHMKGATKQSPTGVPLVRARARLSAFVYGNVLVLAALLQERAESVRTGGGFVLVVVTMVTTYLAHVVADLVGEGLGRDRTDRGHASAELRDAVPILSSGGPPALLLGLAALGWLDWVAPEWVLLGAVGFVLLRLAGVGWVASRFRGGVSRGATLWSGVGLAAVGLVIAVLKVLLGH
jgi:hypothetical protein